MNDEKFYGDLSFAQVYILYGILMSDIPQKMGPKGGDHKAYI